MSGHYNMPIGLKAKALQQSEKLVYPPSPPHPYPKKNLKQSWLLAFWNKRTQKRLRKQLFDGILFFEATDDTNSIK